MEAESRLESVPARLLHTAALRVGGAQQLAEALGVPPMQVACWMSNLQRPPRAVLLSAAAIILGGAAASR